MDTALGEQVAAIEKLSQQHYDLLLLDLRMPEISGHDVMQHMAQHNISTMTVVVSGETSIDDISRALRNGAYDYLKKPYVPEELLATVNNAVMKKRLEDANRVMETRLNRSEKLHRCIVNNSPDIIYILDEVGCFSFLNSKSNNYSVTTAANCMDCRSPRLSTMRIWKKRVTFSSKQPVHSTTRAVSKLPCARASPVKANAISNSRYGRSTTPTTISICRSAIGFTAPHAISPTAWKPKPLLTSRRITIC